MAVVPPSPRPNLSDVEKTAVRVSWYRHKGAYLAHYRPQLNDQAGRLALLKQLSAPDTKGLPREQLLYDPSYDERFLGLCMAVEDEQELQQRASRPQTGPDMMAVRTASLDDALMAATGGSTKRQGLQGSSLTAPAGATPIKQVVILGAGLDARAWRLDWPTGVTVWEVDTGSLEPLKHQVLGPLPLRCAARHALVADLKDTQQLEAALRGAGYESTQPVVWLLEGLIGYLSEEDGTRLLRALYKRSASGSQLVMTCPPTPARRVHSQQEGYKLHHVTFESLSRHVPGCSQLGGRHAWCWRAT